MIITSLIHTPDALPPLMPPDAATRATLRRLMPPRHDFSPPARLRLY